MAGSFHFQVSAQSASHQRYLLKQNLWCGLSHTVSENWHRLLISNIKLFVAPLSFILFDCISFNLRLTETREWGVEAGTLFVLFMKYSRKTVCMKQINGWMTKWTCCYQKCRTCLFKEIFHFLIWRQCHENFIQALSPFDPFLFYVH